MTARAAKPNLQFAAELKAAIRFRIKLERSHDGAARGSARWGRRHVSEYTAENTIKGLTIDRERKGS